MEKVSTFADRLKTVMAERKLRQVDVYNLCRPYFDDVNVHFAPSMLSQYISGAKTPRPARLNAIARALSVNPDWLAGMNVDRTTGEILPMTEDDRSALAAEVIQVLASFCDRLGFEITRVDGTDNYRIRYKTWNPARSIETDLTEMLVKFDVIAGVAKYAMTHTLLKEEYTRIYKNDTTLPDDVTKLTSALPSDKYADDMVE